MSSRLEKAISQREPDREREINSSGMIENYSNDFLLFLNTINVHGLIKRFCFHDCVSHCLSLSVQRLGDFN